MCSTPTHQAIVHLLSYIIIHLITPKKCELKVGVATWRKLPNTYVASGISKKTPLAVQIKHKTY